MHREEAKLRCWMLMGMLLVFMACRHYFDVFLENELQSCLFWVF